LTVAITNEASSSLARIAEISLLARAGREESVAATKTYTCQLMALYLLTWALGGKIDGGELRQVPDAVRAAISLEPSVAAIAERYTFMTHAVTVGRGLNYANALEFGLKLMETCYVVAERFSAADLMHGPIAMVERAFPVFVFAPCGVTWEPVAGVLERVAKLTSETLAIAESDNSGVAAKASRVISLPSIPHPAEGAPADLYTPIPFIVPAQLFAAHLAAIKGLNPDQPRTLQKVTQTL
jgi:glucosamine--fructose-6-phosphate aminotransferase (isomerizing)